MIWEITFLVSGEYYDVKRQLSVIAGALEHLGLPLRRPAGMIV